MPDTDDPHELLGVEEGASKSEIRRAYLRMVKRFPPDRDPESFRRVRDAFEACVGGGGPIASQGSKEGTAAPTTRVKVSAAGRTDEVSQPLQPFREDGERLAEQRARIESAVVQGRADEAVELALGGELGPRALVDPETRELLQGVGAACLLDPERRRSAYAAAAETGFDALLDAVGPELLSVGRTGRALTYVRACTSIWRSWRRMARRPQPLVDFMSRVLGTSGPRRRELTQVLLAAVHMNPGLYHQHLRDLSGQHPVWLVLFEHQLDVVEDELGKAGGGQVPPREQLEEFLEVWRRRYRRDVRNLVLAVSLCAGVAIGVEGYKRVGTPAIYLGVVVALIGSVASRFMFKELRGRTTLLGLSLAAERRDVLAFAAKHRLDYMVVLAELNDIVDPNEWAAGALESLVDKDPVGQLLARLQRLDV